MTDEDTVAPAPARPAPLAGVQSQAAIHRRIFAPSTKIGPPPKRLLNIYAFDPSRGRRVGNVMSVAIDYETLAPGPIGSRFAVIDYDGATRTFCLPVDLDDPMILARQGGLEPSETDPRFHQQMVYAIASETLERFQKALGRRVHWRRPTDADGAPIYDKPNRLSLHPHALCQANAFYSPAAHAILFGYFAAGSENYGENLPGQTVFTCLSHDIVAHETTHAIVDGIRSYFMEPTNIDVAAFHEAFADLTALFQHFTHKDVLLDTLQKTGGKLYTLNLETDHVARTAGSAAVVDEDGSARAPDLIQRDIAQQNPLIALATQFGQASGMHGGLRSALGVPPSPEAITKIAEPHERGSILVAAVFDAYFTVYLNKAAPLLALASGSAALPQPLAELLATNATKMAETFFELCARALDYCPPVDLTFGDFLRALITADLDFYPDDTDGIRDALMQAFRLRGIVAEGASYFSEQALCWPRLAPDALPAPPALQFGDPNGLTRAEQDSNGKLLRAWARENAVALGFSERDPDDDPGAEDRFGITVPSFHPMFRVAQSGELKIDMVVELVQTRTAPLYPGADGGPLSTFKARSGVTLIIAKPAMSEGQRDRPYVRYAIAKHLTPERLDRQSAALAASPVARHSADGHFSIDFALLHQE